MAEPVRFVHAADLHLDAPFKGVDATDPRVKDALIASTYDALEALVDVCLGQAVDFLVIAGDAYNASERSLRAEFAFRDACERLTRAGIRVYVARGNHDPASSRSAGLVLPAGVHVFSENEVERIVHERDGREVCALYGRSFRTSAETANLAAGFKRDRHDKLAIGVLHANVGGRTDHEPYAPCSLEDLRVAKMDYWALGHIHKPEQLADSPMIAYSGCTQGLSPNESGPRGCRVVTLDGGDAQTEFIATSAVVWARETVDASGFESIEEVIGALGQAVDAAARNAQGRPAVVRLEIVGRTPVHDVLARPGVTRDVQAEIRAASLDRDPWVWVDRIADSTRSAVDLGALREGQDLASDLVKRADETLGDSEALRALIDDASAQVFAALDTRDIPELDRVALLERARDLVLDRLLAGDER
ncbi:MAG: exonuclease SbcCD subunit D [Actinobacteria bacterium]|nr:exonuclease SbcCD subunit D [Actinomycetota bacterium]